MNSLTLVMSPVLKALNTSLTILMFSSVIFSLPPLVLATYTSISLRFWKDQFAPLFSFLADVTQVHVIYHHLIGERLGLNPTDHKCLDVIIRNRTPMTASQLAEETGLSTGAITGVVDRLEKAGYVRRKRDQGDRRLVFINALLDKALAKLSPIFDPIKQASRHLYSKYSDEELAIILDFIINCNKMTQEITTNMKMENKQQIKSGLPIIYSLLVSS